jgi:hypothetical protein
VAATRDVWSPRIGPEASNLLARAALLSRIGFAVGICFVPAFITSQWQESPVGEATSFFVLVPTMISFFVLSARLQTRARRLAEKYLQLPPGSWKYLTVRSPDRFDRWLMGQDKPGWPVKGWR